ncbi:MAG: hypothetical protein KAU31_00885, partial [Spirochaetaceae bacterium]|nr:hypothetical protein [Spirochaetaceae bacterium]
RIAALERLFNIKAGVRPEDDSLPDRFSEEPIEVAGKERVVSRETIAQLRRDYYELRKWDHQGRPSDSLLKTLGVKSRSA